MMVVSHREFPHVFSLPVMPDRTSTSVHQLSANCHFSSASIYRPNSSTWDRQEMHACSLTCNATSHRQRTREILKRLSLYFFASWSSQVNHFLSSSHKNLFELRSGRNVHEHTSVYTHLRDVLRRSNSMVRPFEEPQSALPGP